MNVVVVVIEYCRRDEVFLDCFGLVGYVRLVQIGMVAGRVHWGVQRTLLGYAWIGPPESQVVVG